MTHLSLRIFTLLLIVCSPALASAAPYFSMMVARGVNTTDISALSLQAQDSLLSPYIQRVDASFQKIDASLPYATQEDRAYRLQVLNKLQKDLEQSLTTLSRRGAEIPSVRTEVLSRMYEYMLNRTQTLIEKTQ